LIIEIPACSGYLFETIKNLPVQVFEKKKKSQIQKREPPVLGLSKKFKERPGFTKDPAKNRWV
jgi:hypothetical protein